MWNFTQELLALFADAGYWETDFSVRISASGQNQKTASNLDVFFYEIIIILVMITVMSYFLHQSYVSDDLLSS